jgi:hypothetical protein
MKIYPHQNQSNKLNKYQLNIHHINQISHYQPIPSIPALSEDFNFTFLSNFIHLFKLKIMIKPIHI